MDAGKNVDDIIEAIRKGRCMPEGTLIPYIHRTIRFYADVTARHIASSPSEIISIFKQVWSGSDQISQEYNLEGKIMMNPE